MNWIHTAVRCLGISILALAYVATSNVSKSSAETYIGGQFGAALPMIDGGLRDVDDLTTSDPSLQFIPGTTHSNLELTNSLLWGGKIGHYFTQAKWFGLEAEFFHSTPHIKQQVHAFQNPSVPGVTPSATFQGAYFRVMTLAPVNLMFRYHKTRLQPYFGVGPAIFFARITGEGLTPNSQASTSDNARLGLNVKVGFEYYITRHLTAFGEWKYNYARFAFGENSDLFPFPYGFNATYDMHLVSFGIGYHF